MSTQDQRRIKKYSLPKSERLTGKKTITDLFSRGESFFLYPLKIYFLQSPTGDAVPSVLISVSKRIFKKAVDRNRIKRLLRESYRRQKVEVFGNSHSTHPKAIAIVYIGKGLPDFSDIDHKLKTALRRFTEQTTGLNTDLK